SPLCCCGSYDTRNLDSVSSHGVKSVVGLDVQDLRVRLRALDPLNVVRVHQAEALLQLLGVMLQGGPGHRADLVDVLGHLGVQRHVGLHPVSEAAERVLPLGTQLGEASHERPDIVQVLRLPLADVRVYRLDDLIDALCSCHLSLLCSGPGDDPPWPYWIGPSRLGYRPWSLWCGGPAGESGLP